MKKHSEACRWCRTAAGCTAQISRYIRRICQKSLSAKQRRSGYTGLCPSARAFEMAPWVRLRQRKKKGQSIVVRCISRVQLSAAVLMLQISCGSFNGCCCQCFSMPDPNHKSPTRRVGSALADDATYFPELHWPPCLASIPRSNQVSVESVSHYQPFCVR